MKLAHLILAHTDPGQLARLVGRLRDEQADIYIHLDLKTDIAPFRFLADQQGVYFIGKRVKVSWGSYSIVQATLNSFEEILNTGRQYHHINLISGQDYPLKKASEIRQFLAANPGKIFMHCLSVEREWHEAIPRITGYHLANYTFKGKYTVQRILTAILPKRRLPKGFEAMGRSQWLTATPESLRYAIDYVKNNAWVSRFFKMSWAADELIFQTILHNSPYKERIVNDNLLYVDWSEKKASPKVLTMDDVPAMVASGKLFARKFNSSVDTKVLDYLDANCS